MPPSIKLRNSLTGNKYGVIDRDNWFHEGYADRPWIKELWNRYRSLSSAPTVGWKQKHDDSYYRNAIEKQRKK